MTLVSCSSLRARAQRCLIAGLAAGTTSCAQAHDGHGLWGSHWHATDTLGFVAVGLALGVALWWGRK